MILNWPAQKITRWKRLRFATFKFSLRRTSFTSRTVGELLRLITTEIREVNYGHKGSNLK